MKLVVWFKLRHEAWIYECVKQKRGFVINAKAYFVMLYNVLFQNGITQIAEGTRVTFKL